MSDERPKSEQPAHRPRAVPIDPTQMGLSEFYRPDEDEGTSLTDLSGAYAELINSGEDPYQSVETKESVVPIEEAEKDSSSKQPVSVAITAEEEAELSPRSILEAMLFVGDPTGQPLEAAKVASLMRGVSSQEIDELVTELNFAYDEVGSVFEIRRENAGYVMGLRHEHEQMRERFYGRVRETKLSQVAIDVLAVVAYNQGISRQAIDAMRDQASGSVLSQLVRRQMLRLERTEDKPRKTIYFTTDRFLKVFGLDNIEDLPQAMILDHQW
ncbi:MAG: SMC-Scp complex subunit ScpB [Planctomycetota bacterium]|nr:SMC-Scp complex subunit ScpB [Planctomycetota bacterium]